MSEARKTTYRPTPQAEKELTKLFKRFNYSTENGAINDVVENYQRVYDERDKLRNEKQQLEQTLQALENQILQWKSAQTSIFSFFEQQPKTRKK